MANTTGAIRAGRAFVEIFGEDSHVQRVLSRVETRLTSFGQGVTRIGAGLTAVGVGIVSPLFAAARVAGEYGGTILAASQKTGVWIEAIQELAFAASQAGSSLEGLTSGLKFLQRNLAAGAAGGHAAIALFKSIGLSVDELKRLTPEQQLARVADAIAAIDDPARRTSAAVRLLGRAGTELIPLFAGGSAGLAALRAQARSLGQVLDSETIRSAEAVGDAFEVVSGAIRATITAVGAALEPVLTPLAESFGRISATVQEWVGHNRQFVQSVLAIGVGLTVAGGVISALGVALLGLGAAVSLTSAGLAAIGVVLGALLSPAGLAVAAVVGLGVAFVTYTEIGQQAFQAVTQAVGEFAARVQQGFAGIVDALLAGDLALAAKIAWLTVKVAATEALDGVLDYVRDFQRDAALVFVELGAAINSVWINAFAALYVSMDAALLYLYKGLGEFAKGINQARVGFEILTGQVSAEEGGRQVNAANSGVDAVTDVVARNIATKLGEQIAQRNRDEANNESVRTQAIDEIFKGRDRNRQQSDDELAEAIAELAKSREEAATKRAAAEQKTSDRLAGTDLQDAARKFSSAGTFNPFAVRGLGAKDSLTKAAEETAKNTAQLVNKFQQGAFGF